ncbi:MAG: ligase-associated DNA damage response endonuclease PdeM [Paracoccaceae bacterium]|nr:ligase-associated DNA damage response endonuclease PdeM [Paracoccaceae bacterium]
MNIHAFDLAGERLAALPSGALHWPAMELLCVSDLHLCKAERMARRGGEMLPPYETRDTLGRLEADIRSTGAATVICLGDSFDDRQAAEAMEEDDRLWLARLQAGRRWVWIEGNHDPGALGFGGTYLAEYRARALTFRHIAEAGAESGEISGHYHPKARISARGKTLTRACFLTDGARLILPAYGTYTGGLPWTDPAIRRLFGVGARAFLTGTKVHAVPVP